VNSQFFILNPSPQLTNKNPNGKNSQALLSLIFAFGFIRPEKTFIRHPIFGIFHLIAFFCKSTPSAKAAVE
jgi:hypothetical protein